MKKKLVAALLTAAMAMSLLAGCGSGDSKGSDADSKETAESTEDSDQEAADKVADLIDAYLCTGENRRDTDKQCEAAKTAWDAADRCTERAGSRRKCRSGLFWKRYRRCIKR